MPRARLHPDYVDPREVDEVGLRWNWFKSESVVLPVPEFVNMPNEDRTDFVLVPMKCHRHPNGGGWVSDQAYVAPSVRVDPAGFVAGTAFLTGETVVYNYNGAFGSSRLYGRASLGEGTGRGFFKLYGNGQMFGQVTCVGPGGEGEVFPEAPDGARAYGSIQILGGAGITDGGDKGDVFGAYKALEDPEYVDTKFPNKSQHHADFCPIRGPSPEGGFDLASGEHDIRWSDTVNSLWKHIHELNERDGFEPTSY